MTAAEDISRIANAAAPFHDAIMARFNDSAEVSVLVSDRGAPVEYIRACHKIGGHGDRPDLWYAGFKVEVDSSLPYGTWRFSDETAVGLH